MSADRADRPHPHERLETLIAVLLGLAAVLVAASSYQATLRDGDSVKAAAGLGNGGPNGGAQ